jgi:hypothetical protein
MIIFWKNTDRILEEQKELGQIVKDEGETKLMVSEEASSLQTEK